MTNYRTFRMGLKWAFKKIYLIFFYLSVEHDTDDITGIITHFSSNCAKKTYTTFSKKKALFRDDPLL